MKRLVYAPKVYAFVRTDKYPKGLDISDYIVRGNVHRRKSAASSAEIEIRNPNGIFTKIGDPTFHPMDAITIFLCRLKGYPVQVFTGYLDSADAIQLYPNTITLTASCTIKRLLNTFWDPALPYVQSGFLAKYGWIADPQTGILSNPDALAKTLDESQNKQLTDGSMGALLFAVLRHVGNWDPDDIYIERLPASIIGRMTAIYNELSLNNKDVKNDLTALFTKLVGPGSYGTGGGAGNDPTTKFDSQGNLTIEHLVQLAESVGAKGEAAAIAAAIGMAESDGDPTAENSIPCVGIWQVNQPAHPKWSVAQLKVPSTNAEAMWEISNHGTDWSPWTTFTGADTGPGGGPGPKTYLKYIDAARSAVGKVSSDPVDTQPKQGAAPHSPANQTTSTTRWDAILAEANRIDALHKPYSFGSGHSTPVPKDGPWDCSSAISALLQAAGYNVPTFATPQAPSILEPGEGQRITFWNNANPGAGGHIYAFIDGKRWGAESQQDSGWLSGPGPRSGYKPFTVPGGEKTLDEPYNVPANANTNVPGGSSTTGDTNTGPDTSMASAFATYLNFPSIEQTAEAIGLQGQKSLMNDQPLFPFIEQLCGASLREFMSLPNGDFFAFFPDYFGGFEHRQPYWLIDDVEILDGKVTLTDDQLATHVYVVGDIVPDGQVTFLDMLQSGGVITMFDAFKAGFIRTPASVTAKAIKDGNKFSEVPGLDRDYVLQFLQRYGARPHYEEAPMVRSPYFEAFLAYQRFMQLWAKQFATTFTFTFMPEVYPGGIVGFPDHNLQCFVEEVIHTFDYESGFATQAVLSAPASMKDAGTEVSAGMVRAFNYQDRLDIPPKSKPKPQNDKPHPVGVFRRNPFTPNWLQKPVSTTHR